MSLLQPDRYFSRVSAISANFDVSRKGYRFVFLDVDNTVKRRDTHDVPPDVHSWIADLKERGIGVCLVSNSWHKGVHETARDLDVPIAAKALKPLPIGFLRACRELGAKPHEVLMIGDQIGTDILGAHLLGMGAYLVCPLCEVDILSSRIAHSFERLFISDLEPEGVEACDASRS